MVVKPTRELHFGNVKNRLSFEDAFEFLTKNPGREYKTSGNQATFIAVASRTTKGRHKGEYVIVFKSEGKEMARSYPCCWGHRTNCNRTYIDCYTSVL